MIYNKNGFSIIEVMIGIFVFALGLTSVFMMLSGSITMSDYSRNLIIASHLANEELELFKNIRDSNYSRSKYWAQTNPDTAYDASDPSKTFQVGQYYTLENDYGISADFPIFVNDLRLFEEGNQKIVPYMENYRLYLDNLGRYTYEKTNDSGPNEGTQFYRYIYVEAVEYEDGGTQTMDNALKVSAKVIWTHGGFHSTKVSTIVSDWKKY